MQYVYRHSTNGLSEVITRVELNCTSEIQGVHHVQRLI